MQTTDPSVPPVGNVQTTFRMTRTEYAKFERTLPTPVVNDNTSELHAGMKLGVQMVLAQFRQHFVEGM
jgi:hypothetical protein